MLCHKSVRLFVIHTSILPVLLGLPWINRSLLFPHFSSGSCIWVLSHCSLHGASGSPCSSGCPGSSDSSCFSSSHGNRHLVVAMRTRGSMRATQWNRKSRGTVLLRDNLQELREPQEPQIGRNYDSYGTQRKTRGQEPQPQGCWRAPYGRHW